MKCEVLCFVLIGVSLVLGEPFEYECDILQRLDYLENKAKASDKVNADLEKVNHDLESKVNEQAQLIIGLTNKVTKLEESYKTPTVVFKARQASRRDLDDGRVIVFTESVINRGDGYDVTTGYFTVPVAGTYVFSSQLCCTNAGWAHVQIIANGVIVESTSHHGSDGDGTCMTFTGVAVMHVGETAYVQSAWYTGQLAENAHRWNSFSGVLINIIL